MENNLICLPLTTAYQRCHFLLLRVTLDHCKVIVPSAVSFIGSLQSSIIG
jgi:hypothetical protein